jgi:large subunit ribosomal protein L25
MGLVELKVMPRSTKGKNANRRTRAAGMTPAVIYGNQRDSRSVQIDSHDFGKALGKLAGRSAIFALSEEGVDDEAIALLRDVQRHPVTDEILHVDLFEIPRGQPVVVPVWVQLTGESQAVKRGDAILDQALDTIEIRCLPRELPESIAVDTSELNVNDKIFVGDVSTPVGEIVSDAELLVVAAKAPAIFVEPTEEVEAAEDEEAVEGAEDEEAAGEGEEEKPSEES